METPRRVPIEDIDFSKLETKTSHYLDNYNYFADVDEVKKVEPPD